MRVFALKALVTTIALPLLAAPAMAEVRSFQTMAVEINGVKFWMPSSFTVRKGDVVKIHAVSKVPGKNSVHGFAIDAFKIQQVADTKGVDIEFTADKAGVFPIRCHMHPPHVGGQLIVLE